MLLGLTCFFFACHVNPEEESERAIKRFIVEMAEDYQTYSSKSFQKIDRAFLEDQEVIQRSLLALQDTTQRKVQELRLANLAQEAEKLIPFTNALSVDQLDDLLKVRVQLNQHLKEENISEAYREALNEEEGTIEFLDQVLSHFNLSVYSLDLESEAVIYYHEFLMDGEERSGIFEVEKENQEVLSFRLLS